MIAQTADLLIAVFALIAVVGFATCVVVVAGFAVMLVRDHRHDRREARRRPGPLPRMTFEQIIEQGWPERAREVDRRG